MFLQSPSHEFVSSGPELFSTTDNTPYAAILLINRVSDPAQSAFQFGGPQITASAGGKQLSSGDAYLISIPGRPVKLTEIWIAGNPGDFVDTICFPY